jgi:hypothetical protein
MTARPLLTLQNPKLLKGEKRGYRSAVLHLAPHKLSGFNVCPMATAGCSAACLNTAGRGGIPSAGGGENAIQIARKRRTVEYFTDRPEFMGRLCRELERFIDSCKRDGFVPAIRLNGTSDLRWETVAVDGAPNVMGLFPEVQFYDYTKLPNRRDLPPNYHLTYSLAEGQRNWRGHLVALDHGMSVAVVLAGCGDSRFPRPFPPMWNGRPLIDGDESDLRFLDPPSVYVGLRAKGKAKRDTSGFVRTIERVQS